MFFNTQEVKRQRLLDDNDDEKNTVEDTGNERWISTCQPPPPVNIKAMPLKASVSSWIIVLFYLFSFSQCSFFKVSWILMFLRTLFWWWVIFTKNFYLQVAMASWGFNLKHIQALILPVINMHCCFIPIYMVYIWYLLLLFWRLACQSKESYWIFFCCRYSLRESSETTKPGEKKIQVLKQKGISCLPLYLCYWNYLLF